MKKLLYCLTISLILFSCKKEDANSVQNPQTLAKTNSIHLSSKLAPQQNVQLYKSWSMNAYAGYGYYYNTKTFYVEVANLAYQKNVFAHQQMGNGLWQDFPLKYLNSIGDNTEMWGLVYDYSGWGTSNNLGDSFAIKYVVNGQTYWDNNSGKNYTVCGSEGMYLQNGVNISVDTSFSYYSSNSATSTSNFYIVADVRNIAMTKNVTVVYSTDGWKTTLTSPLSFSKDFAIGDEAFLISPNVFGIERWVGSIIMKSSSQKFIQFAVSYTVNGQTYWDNNFGNNYQLQVQNY